jgi:hypothetical protein
MDAEQPSKISVRVQSRGALVIGWVLSVVMAAGLGWLVGRSGVPERPETEGAGLVTQAGATGGGGDLLRQAAERARQEAADREALAEEPPAPEPQIQPVDPSPPPAPTPQIVEPLPEPEEVPVPEPDQPDELPRVDVEQLTQTELLAGVERIDRLYEDGEREAARAEARSLLEPAGSYSGLVAALVDKGTSEPQAQLNAVRVLQAAGHDLISRELARELKRSYAGTESVSETIWDWGVLSPRILSTESTIERGRTVVVLGTLENPDIGDVRRVQVEVEALDAAGNRLARVEVRIRPRVIGPGETADFSAGFKGLDPASVIRTRATVLKWESEVLTPG